VCSTGIDLLCEGGWEAFTTENIARRLNVSRGVLYNYFRDKNDILYAIARSSISDLCDNLEKIASDGRSSSERMLAMAEFIVRTFHEKRKYHRAIMENVPPPKDSSHPVILGDKRRTAIFEGVLRDGVAGILFNGAIHHLCMLSDFQDQYIDPAPVIQLFLRSLQK